MIIDAVVVNAEVHALRRVQQDHDIVFHLGFINIRIVGHAHEAAQAYEQQSTYGIRADLRF